MGADFALYVSEADAERVIEVAAQCGVDAWVAGNITKTGDEKRVVIQPKNLTYAGDTLGVR